MTRPEGAAPRPSRPAWVRAARWIVAKGWIHALLLICVGVCVYPLLWMFMTSVKTDEEIGRDEVVPTIPVFRDHSPYVRDPFELARPADVDPARFAAVLPALRALTMSTV